MRALHSTLVATALISTACGKPAAPQSPNEPTPPARKTSTVVEEKPAPPPAAAGPILIGHYAPMTGPMAPFGISADQGVRLAVEERNANGGVKGRKIELVTIDDLGKSSEAAVAAKRLIEDHKVTAIIGEVASSATLAAGPFAQKAKIPMITAAATNPIVTEVGDYIFRACFVDDFQAWADAKFARENLKATKAAVLYDQSQAYSTGLGDSFAREFENLGGKIVIRQPYTGGSLDLDTQLKAIKKSGAQVVFVPGYYSDAGTILRKAREGGIKAPLLGGDGWESEELSKIAGDAVNGSFYSTHFASSDTGPESARFTASYKAKYSMEPDSLAAVSFDAAQVLFDALERAPSLTGADVRDALASTRGFVGVTGPLAFDAERNAQRTALIVTYKDGKPVVAARIAKP